MPPAPHAVRTAPGFYSDPPRLPLIPCPVQVHAREAGIRAVVFNSRGTSGSPVQTAQFYSASFTEDMR